MNYEQSLGDDSFTLANLQNRFKEIMSLTVKPSSNTDLLDVPSIPMVIWSTLMENT